jgi:hypothetical protein
VALILPQQLPQSGLAAPIVLTFLSIAYSGSRLALLAAEGRQKLMSLTFWVFAYAWMGIAPLAQLTSAHFPWPGMFSGNTLVNTVSIVLLGYIAYDLGSWFGGSRSFAIEGLIASYGLTLSKWRVYVLGILAAAISGIAIFRLGGIQTLLLSTRVSFEEEVSSALGKTGILIWFTLLRTPVFVGLLLAWWTWLNRRRLRVVGWRERAWLAALLLALAILVIIAVSPISAPRYIVGTIVLSFAFLSLRWNRRHSMGLWVACLVGAFVGIFSFTDAFRWEGESNPVVPVAEQLAYNGDYDAFEQLVNTLEFVSANGVTFGMQLLGVLLFWVPRSVWLDKPLGSGQLVAEFSQYSYTNLSCPLWAEAYINFGSFGVFLAFFFYGIATTILQNSYMKSDKEHLSLIRILVPILAAYQIFFLRGDLMAAFAYLVPIIGYLLLAAKMVRTPADQSSNRLQAASKVSRRIPYKPTTKRT